MSKSSKSIKSTTHLVLPDTQCKPGVPLEHLSWAGQYVVDRSPDVVVMLGDWWDMPSLSSYDAGKKSFEGRMYKADIEAGLRGMDLFLAPLKKAKFKPRLVFLHGNHECVHFDTEILTSVGWVQAAMITKEHEVASFGPTANISFNKPLALAVYPETPLLRFSSNLVDELVSDNHKFIVDGQRTVLQVGDKVKQERLTLAGYRDSSTCTNRYADDEIRLLTWIVMDGCVFWSTNTKVRIQFKLSKSHKIEALTSLLTSMGIRFTFKPATKSGINKLQPYMIRIYGEEARCLALETGFAKTKRLPSDFSRLSPEQALILVDTIAKTDGTRKDRSILWNTTSLLDAETVQLACITSGLPCKITPTGERKSGFANGKPQHRVTIAETKPSNKFYGLVTEAGVGTVIGIQTVDGTLITRRNGKVAFTGNSRIERAVEGDRKLEGTIGLHDLRLEESGWEVYPFLQPVVINGISYCHFFPRAGSGAILQTRNGAPSAKAQLQREGRSCTAGHRQGLDITPLSLGGRLQWGLIAGSFYQHHENYLSPQGNDHWRGLVVKHEVSEGSYDPMLVSLDYLKRRYGA